MVSTLYFNGQKRFTKLHDTDKGLNKWFANGTWFLGQDQDVLGGSFEKQQSLSGTLSMINVWDRIITDEEVIAMSNCSSELFGNVFNWNEASWELSNVERVQMDTREFCEDFPDKNYFMLPERRSLESGYEVCKKMGGSVSTPMSMQENEFITSIGDSFYDVCEAKSQSGKTMWIGIQRNSVGNWTVISF